MSWRRGKTATSGWAAFDLKQRGKQGLESVADAEPYPSLSSSVAPREHSKTLTGKNKKNGLDNPVLFERPFMSALVRTVDFPALMVNERDKTAETRSRRGGDSSLRQGIDMAKKNGEELSVLHAAKKLEECFPWAERSLIEDVLVGVNNNIDEASSVLKAMESSKDNEAETEELKFCSEEVDCKVNTLLGNEGVTSLKTADFVDLKSVIEEYDEQKETKKEVLDDHVFLGNMLLSDGAATNTTLSNMKFYPIEPELEEEDDVYLVHRKDAIKMMRSASRHSKAATDAFVRGDHFSAQHYSRKAQEEWVDAQRLNAEAAKEILSIKNCTNDLWTLDLHGLHAAEAIQALQEHLQKIESLVSFNHIAADNRSSTMPNDPHSVSLGSLSCYERMKHNELPSASRKSANLHVITGKGNHSRGQAALPAAVRSFLSENGYHYDELRPGVVTVRPMFRQG